MRKLCWLLPSWKASLAGAALWPEATDGGQLAAGYRWAGVQGAAWQSQGCREEEGKMDIS